MSLDPDTIPPPPRSINPANTPLRRRAADPTVAVLPDYPANSFWQQARTVFNQFISGTQYQDTSYITVYSGAKPLSEVILDFVNASTDPQCLLLSGQYGVGKSSILRHTETQIRAQDQGAPYWVYFDGNDYAAEIESKPESLGRHIANAASAVIEHLCSSGKTTTREMFANIYTHDREFSRHRLVSFDLDGPDLKAVSQVFLSEPLSALTLMLRFLKRLSASDRVVLVIDNIDPLPLAVQIDIALKAVHLATASGARVLVSVRDGTRAQIKNSNPQAIAAFECLNITAPPMHDVIKRRIDLVLAEQVAQGVVIGDGANRYRVSDCPEFSITLSKALAAERSRDLVTGLSNGSVREALVIAQSIFSSHFLDARKIIRALSPANTLAPTLWNGYLPYYVVIKSIVLNNHRVYKSTDNHILGNALGTPLSRSSVGPYLRLLLLCYLQKHIPQEVTYSSIRTDLCRVLSIPSEQVSAELRWLKEQDWIAEIERGMLVISMRGSYVITKLTTDPEYLAHIAPDVELPEPSEALVCVPTELSLDRICSLYGLLSYLVPVERNLLTEMSGAGTLREYPHYFRTRGLSRLMIAPVQEMIDREIRSFPASSDGLHRKLLVRWQRKFNELFEAADVTDLFADVER